MWKPYKGRNVHEYISDNKANASLLRKGVTLVELAIVILILSILLLVVFTVVSGIVQISTQSSPTTEMKRRAFFAMQVLKSSVDQAYYQVNHKRLWFVGRKDGVEGARNDRLTFSAVHPEASNIGVASVREVSYYLEEQEDSTYTLMRREDQLVDEEPGKGGAHYELLKNVTSLQLQYSQDGKDWLNEWDSRKKNRTPKVVLIELTVALGNKNIAFKILSHPGINLK